jgi:MFS family permease
LDRFLPPTPLARRLSVQSVLFAIGEGTFLTGSAVFFTQIVGLTAGQVGIGITVAGLAAFVCSVPLGKLTDRIGPKRMWALGAGSAAALYAVWPLIDSFATFIAMMIALQLVETAGWSGRGAYTIDVFPRAERVESQAFMRAALNIGFTLGALISGIALAFNNDDLIRAVPVFTALMLAINTLYITQLPDATHDRAPTPTEEKVGRGALRNRGFLLLNVCDGVLGTNQVLLNIVIPLWLVQETDAPRVLLAWLFGTNTVLAVLLQVAAARGVVTVADSLRALRRGAAFFVLSCGIVLVTHDTIGWITIALVWIGHVTVTGAELFDSAGEWGLQAELSDPARRGEYQGVSQLGYTVGSVWAPAAYTFLAMEWGTPGWLIIAAIVAVAAIAIHPAARAAERHLALEATPVPSP